jgi:hypothetical protein
MQHANEAEDHPPAHALLEESGLEGGGGALTGGDEKILGRCIGGYVQSRKRDLHSREMEDEIHLVPTHKQGKERAHDRLDWRSC